MNIQGWIFLAVFWSIVIGLLVFCFVRVFSEPEEDL
jgi:hypothetical protein